MGTIPMRSYEIGNVKGASRDGSFLPYIAEELISQAAYSVSFNFRCDNFVKSIPRAFNDRVNWVDQAKSQRLAISFLAPILDEFGIEYEGCEYRFKKNSFAKSNEELFNCVTVVMSYLTQFYAAVEYKLQLDIDLKAFKGCIELIMLHSRAPESRGNLAVLKGILTSYELVESPSLVHKSYAGKPVIEHFQRLSNDCDYQELSRNAHDLGYRDKTKRALELMRRFVGDILKNEKLSKGLDQSTKAISVASQIHIPDAQVAESLLNNGYLPPIISLKEQMVKAHSIWKMHSPEIILAK
ncbi:MULTISPECIES: hypothetical protein [unclassified Vibrio]|nr:MULTISPECIES: hypothetical protein [unclassified Vibrio]NAW56349.1 hypothetical protein [Vibrio sp. V36_P2S2PM302]NAX25539.1 hypothetical protein [Vibrio sp. V38_P2S17PM301]NAX30412.1 hypothetical protein [Vibrio sp. V37_P2S8PM304]